MHELVAPLGRYKKQCVLSIVGTVLEVVAEVLLPIVMASLIDEGLEGEDMGAVGRYGIIMVVITIISLLCGLISAYYAAEASVGYGCGLREAIYRKVQTFSFANIDTFSPASLVTRMTTDITNIQNAVLMIIRVATRSPVMLVAALVACIGINVGMTPVFVIAIVFLVVVLTLITVFSVRAFYKMFDAYDDLNEDVQENIGAIRVVKAFVREVFESEKFQRAVQKVYDLSVKAESIVAFNNPAMMLAVFGCVLGISWLGAHFVVEGTMTTGELTSMFSYIMMMLMSLMMLSMIVVTISMSASNARRINEVLTAVPTIQSPEHPVTEVKDGSIDFDDVTFNYSEKAEHRALAEIDLHIKSGETIGIVGGTGSGKSSLVNLISRLYDVSKGSLKVGGVDVRDYDLEVLRNNVAVVLQKNVLFSGTVASNLRWGNENATDEELVEACKAAAADEFIEQMPDRYNARIERGGANVSGGQKQRLCIARALLKRPKVLILDDSTSAVDTGTDAQIRAAFKRYIPGTTKIIVAQRISSVQDADRIVVLDNGHVNGIGTHDELVENNEIYRSIYESQAEGTGDFDITNESAAGKEA